MDASEIAYSNPGEAYVFETVASLGVDATEATRIVNGYRNSGVEGKAFADGVKIAFEYGYGNFSQQELAQALEGVVTDVEDFQAVQERRRLNLAKCLPSVSHRKEERRGIG